MALFNCPECNAEISNKADSCPKCGYDVKEFIKTHVRCPECGQYSSKDDSTCPNCGFHLYSDTIPNESVDYLSSIKNILAFCLVLALIAFILGLIAFIQIHGDITATRYFSIN